MTDEMFSKTVRIDLMPGSDGEGLGTRSTARRDPLASATWSTRQRQTAAAAAATRSRYEELLQSVYDAAVITSLSGRILEVNDRAVEFLQYDRAELCSIEFSDVLDGADETLMSSITETLEQERFALLQAYCRRQDGSSFPAEIAVSRLSGNKVRFCFFIRDITVRHKTEEMLRTEHMAVQTCASGIAIADVEGLLAYVNPALLRMLGGDEEGLLHEDIRSVLGENEVVESLIENALNDDNSWEGEIELARADGETVCLQISATGCRSVDGEPRGIVFSFADVTLHKRVESDLAATHEYLEGRIEARTKDLLLQNAELQEALAEANQKLESLNT